MRGFAAYIRRVLKSTFSFTQSWTWIVVWILLPVASVLIGQRVNVAPLYTLILAVLSLAVVFLGQLFLVAFQQGKQTQRHILNDFRNEGVQLLGQTLFTDADQSNWEGRVDEWRDRLRATLAAFFDDAEADSIVVLGTYNPNQTIAGSLNRRHDQKRVMLRERLNRLERLIDSL